jgi:hypothetical protein
MGKMEQWKDIPNYENLYQISSLGNARSLDRFSKNNVLLKGKPIKLNEDKFGYFRFTVTKEGLSKTLRIHRLVGELFIPNPFNFPQLNHKNGNKRDNYKDNLEWCSDSDNKKHAYSKGLMKPGNKYTKNKVKSNLPRYR